MTWQQEQAESKRKQQQHQDRVNGLVLAIQDLLEGQPVEATIEAPEVVLRGLHRLRDEGRR